MSEIKLSEKHYIEIHKLIDKYKKDKTFDIFRGIINVYYESLNNTEKEVKKEDRWNVWGSCQYEFFFNVYQTFKILRKMMGINDIFDLFSIKVFGINELKTEEQKKNDKNENEIKEEKDIIFNIRKMLISKSFDHYQDHIGESKNKESLSNNINDVIMEIKEINEIKSIEQAFNFGNRVFGCLWSAIPHIMRAIWENYNYEIKQEYIDENELSENKRKILYETLEENQYNRGEIWLNSHNYGIGLSAFILFELKYIEDDSCFTGYST